ncbi:MAG: KpsF/GutQ family sugar-phosphate isomerase [Bacteroidales bacterium]|nr:KpsF/GutQ family sugar-phosphate isomerase [Bacteroidales bacterium]
MNKDQILQLAISTIMSERDTLTKLAKSLDNNMVEACRIIVQTRGRVILTGIGKNQFIGQKIAATFNSIGTPAFFMHATDAIHGDLGLIQPDDTIVCLSRSGNSPEIKTLVPLIHSRCKTLIAIVTDQHSYLAKQSLLSIHVPVEREACPYNLTPTNSSTAFLVIGDAMAICLLKMNNFSAEDFGHLHPGGALGKRLFLRVSDLYKINEKPQVTPETSIQKTILEISAKRLGATAVLDNNNSLMGIITDGDLRRLLENHQDLIGLTAADAMTLNVKTILPDALASEALLLMQTNNITQLLVVEDKHYLGVIHIHDILKEGIA